MRNGDLVAFLSILVFLLLIIVMGTICYMLDG